jgi:alpha-D-ribose 1-methylphosphonate 5-triphosphate synthase subunit PhnH
LPPAGLGGDPALDSAAAVLLALLDAGLTVAHLGHQDAARTAAAVCDATGAQPGSVGSADFVLVFGDTRVLPAPPASLVRRGTLSASELGATIVYCGQPTGTRAVIAGPGVDGTEHVDLPLDRGELAALQVANRQPLLGVDAFVVDGHRNLVALPRSVTVDLRPTSTRRRLTGV